MKTAFNVLFLCTGNSARSILSEACLNRLGEGRFHAYSAGSQPKGEVHPCSLRLLKEKDYPTSDYRSKSWDEFEGDGVPKMDLVVTVCGNAADETCPFWPGAPMQVHWGFEDPAAAPGTEDEQMPVFENIYAQIHALMERLVALPVEEMDKDELRAAMLDLTPDK
mgnify:CR=1 FL=1